MKNLVRLIIVALAIAGMTLQTACGTLIYPERRGQDRGEIDPAVVIMDGILLLFLIIPGLVAFAVDFSTGAIYLPEDEESALGARPRVIHVDPKNLTPETLAAAIYEETGMHVKVTDEDLRRLRAARR